MTLYDAAGSPFRQFGYTAPAPGVQAVDCSLCGGSYLCLDADACVSVGSIGACVYTAGCSGGVCQYDVYTPDCDAAG